MRKLAAVFFLLLAAPASAAQPQPVAPSTDQRVALGELPVFQVTAAPGDTVRIGIGPAAQVDGRGRLDPLLTLGEAVAAQPGTFRFQLPADSLLAVRPGRYYWQAVSVGADGAESAGPLRPVSIVRPEGRRGGIPRTVGRRGSGTFLVSRRGIPGRVSADRFMALTRQSAKRWGMRVGGWTSLVPGNADRRNVIGFTRSTPTNVWGRARTIFLGKRVLDRDIQLNARAKWHAGPGYPDMDEGDLETTLIHELGHAAGNGFHVQGCVNSPLVVSGAAGEWWHAPDDHFFFDCARSAS